MKTRKANVASDIRVMWKHILEKEHKSQNTNFREFKIFTVLRKVQVSYNIFYINKLKTKKDKILMKKTTIKQIWTGKFSNIYE